MTRTTGKTEMKVNRSNHGTGIARRSRRRGWAAALCAGLLLVMASPAVADDYDSANAGHPVRMVAYALHPIGVLIEYVILRPANWLGGIEPFKTIFGHED
jgi:hypothetical protein